MGNAIDAILEQQIGKALRQGMGYREAARQFSVSRTTVGRIASGRPARRATSLSVTVRPCRVEWFDCSECHVASNLKWDPDDTHCFACHIRNRIQLERVVQT
jgi:transposase